MTSPEAVTGVEHPHRAPLAISCGERWLIVRFAALQRVLSWAIVGGGFRQTRLVAWHQVDDQELRPALEPQALFRRRLEERNLHDAVGLLTSRSLDSYVDVERRDGPLAARCIATVGLGNALRAGDPPGAVEGVGTVNLLCWVSAPLTEEALVEAVALAAETRAAAILEASVPSGMTGRMATGTGTDCIVIATPLQGACVPYVGKHTPFGHLIGLAVEEAIARGVEQWKREQTHESELRTDRPR